MHDQIMKTLRLLYVEDDATQRKELTDYLKRRVSKLYIANNGEEGLEKFIQNQPNVILCDLRMPRVDGLTMAANVRALNRTVPIIILTALSDKETILASVDQHITNYLIKPVNNKRLEEVLVETAKVLHEAGQIKLYDDIDGEKLNTLKNEIVKLVKTDSGKGPSDVRISVKDHSLEISVYGALTPFERSMLGTDTNHNLVNYNRNVFYQDRAFEMETLIFSAVGQKSELKSVNTDCKTDTTKLEFAFI